jgi:hypothetical protein
MVKIYLLMVVGFLLFGLYKLETTDFDCHCCCCSSFSHLIFNCCDVLGVDDDGYVEFEDDDEEKELELDDDEHEVDDNVVGTD